jgi:hypothetical protein
VLTRAGAWVTVGAVAGGDTVGVACDWLEGAVWDADGVVGDVEGAVWDVAGVVWGVVADGEPPDGAVDVCEEVLALAWPGSARLT